MAAVFVLLAVVAALPVSSVGSPATEPPSPAAADDPPFGPTYRVSGPPDPMVIVEWDQAAEAGGNIVAGWIAFRSKMGCGFSTSTDDGRTWSSPSYVFGQTGSGGDPVVFPDLSGNGEVYIMCIYQKGQLTINGVSKSTDGGVTWGPWMENLVPPAGQGVLDFPDAVARSGKIWMVWNTGKPDTNIMMSTDGAQNWSSSTYLQPGLPACILADSQNRLYVFSGVSIISLQNLRFMHSADGGQTWQASRDLGFRSASRPDCELDEPRSSIYVVTGSSQRKTVYLVRTRDLGNSFDPPVEIWNGSSTALTKIDFASVTVDPRGIVHAGWLDDRNGYMQAWYTNSSDSGSTWLAPILVSDHAKPTCAPSCNQAHYGHGLSATPTGAVCYGFIINVNYSAEYRSSCSYDGVGGRKLAKIEIDPAQAKLSADQTLKFQARGIDTNGAPMPVSPLWSATGGSIDAQGLFAPGKAGTFEVKARQAGVEGRATVEVTAGALATIRVAPGAVTVTADQTAKFSASGEDSRGNPVAVSPTWSVSGGMIDGSGLFTPAAPGKFTVTAADGAAKGEAEVTVLPGALAAIVITPSTAEVRAGSTVGFAATGRDAKGNEAPASVEWSVRGAPGAGSVDPSGLYAPEKVGAYEVVAKAAGLEATAQVTVRPGKLATARIAPVRAETIEGGDLKFAATGNDSKSNPIPSLKVEWRVDGGIGSVDGRGAFTASRAGGGRVVATVSDGEVSIEAVAEVTVTAAGPPMLTYLLVGAAIVAAVAVAAWATVRRRRRRHEMEARQAAWVAQQWRPARPAAWPPSPDPRREDGRGW